MALPRMDSDPTAIDRVPSARHISTSTSICEARAHLHTSGESAGIVYRNGRPIGIVTARALANARMTGREETPVSTVMDYLAVPVDRNADARETMRAVDNAAWDWLKGRPGAATR